MNAQSPNLRVSGSILHIATCHGQDEGMVQREQFIIIIITETVVIDQTESWNNNRFPFYIQFLIVLCSSPIFAKNVLHLRGDRGSISCEVRIILN